MRQYEGKPGWRRLTAPAGIRTPIVVYDDPEDSRLFVPKIGEIGTTLNLAHPGARWLLGAMVVLPLLAGVLVLFVAG